MPGEAAATSNMGTTTPAGDRDAWCAARQGVCGRSAGFDLNVWGNDTQDGAINEPTRRASGLDRPDLHACTAA
jgi:hypothetical protein